MTGIVVLDKPEGMTSFATVKKVRWCFGEKKAGHCGTLDPMATGVLPIMLGGATKFLDYLPDEGKCYTAGFRLGLRTNTLDITGDVLEEHTVTCSHDEVKQALEPFRGEILQVPPMYSALKKDGVRLYELARKGQEVEREARPVTIRSLELLPQTGENPDEYFLTVSCSKGTYIRTLIDDIGSALGCGAVMTSLRRTASCGFSIEEAVTLEELEQAREEDSLEKYLVPLDRALSRYPAVGITPKQSVRFSNGGALDLERVYAFRKGPPEDGSVYRVYSNNREFLGLGETDRETGSLSVKRIFVRR